jgi:hypothetical protein
MGRILNDKPCEVTFLDRISDSKITLTYRMPTTDERVAYANSLVTRRGTKVESGMGEARLKYGAKILLGFKDGSFETDKGPLSCDQNSPNYDPAWKTFISKYAQDIIIMLAVHVFEASVVTSEPDDDDQIKEKEEDPL